MKVEYKKKNGETGYRIDCKPKSMSMGDLVKGTMLVDEVGSRTVPAGVSKDGTNYDAFESFSVFMDIDGDATSVNIPKGTAFHLKKLGSLKGKQLEFFKAEKNVGSEQEPDYKIILDFKVDGVPSQELLSFKPKDLNNSKVSNEPSKTLLDNDKVKVLDYYKSAKKSPNDPLEFKGVMTTFKEVLGGFI